MNVRSDYQSLLLGTAGAVVLLVLWNGGGYEQDLFTLSAVYALIGLGVYVPYVLGGSLAMAYGAYAAIGAYAVALVSVKTDLPIVLGWVAGPIAAAAIAVALGAATRRLSGFYLAAVTLLFGTAFETWLIDTEVVGGSLGFGGLRKLDLLGWEPNRFEMTVLAAVLVVSVAFAVDRIRLSPWGAVVRSMRDVPLAVESAGTRVPTLTLVALAVGAAIASLGGALFATTRLGITPETFTLHIVFLALFMPLIGGIGTPWGAVLGAVIVVKLTIDFDALETSGTLVLALGVIVILMVAPRGVIGYLDALRRQVLSRRGATDG